MAFVSTNTESAFVNSSDSTGIVILPSSISIPQRILLFKDQYGTANISTIAIYTTGIDFNTSSMVDSFENGDISRTFSNSYDTLQVFAGSTTKWYTVGGSITNALTANTGIFSSLKTYATNISSSSNLVNALSVNTRNFFFSTVQTTNFSTQNVTTSSSVYSLNITQANRLSLFNTALIGNIYSSSIFLRNALFSTIETSSLLTYALITDTIPLVSITAASTKASTLTLSSLVTSNLSTQNFMSQFLDISTFSTVSLNVLDTTSVIGTVSTRALSSGFSLLTTDSLSSISVSSGIFLVSSLSTFGFRANTATISSLTFSILSTFIRAILSSANISSVFIRRIFLQNYALIATFFGTGTIQTYTVPPGVTKLSIYMWAAGGGNQGATPGSTGGGGAFISGDISVTSGQVFYIIVGQQTLSGATSLATGGGGASGNSGGGFTGIFSGPPAVGNVIAIAGGGGGGGTNGGGVGGGGGYPAASGGSGSGAGTGGTQVAGGTGSVAGTQLQGGGTFGAGCGGGGWWGGGAGTLSASSSGGGGGSSTYTGTMTNVITVNATQGTLPGTAIPTPAANESHPFYTAPYGRSGYNGYMLIYPEVSDPTPFSYIQNMSVTTQRNNIPILNISSLSSPVMGLSTITGLNMDGGYLSSFFGRASTINTISSGISSLNVSTLVLTDSLSTSRIVACNAYFDSISAGSFFQRSFFTDSIVTSSFSTLSFVNSNTSIDNLSTNRLNAVVGVLSTVQVNTLSTLRPTSTLFFETYSLFLSTNSFRFNSLSNSPSAFYISSVSTLIVSTTNIFYTSSLLAQNFSLVRATFSSLTAYFATISSLNINSLSTNAVAGVRYSTPIGIISSVDFISLFALRGQLDNISTLYFNLSSLSSASFAMSSVSTVGTLRTLDLEAQTLSANHFSSLTAFIETLSTSVVRTTTLTGVQFNRLDYTFDTTSTTRTVIQDGAFSTLSTVNFNGIFTQINTLSTNRFNISSLTIDNICTTNFATSLSTIEIPTANLDTNTIRPITGFTINISSAAMNASTIGVNRLNAGVGNISTLSSIALQANIMNVSSLILQNSTTNTARTGGIENFFTSTVTFASSIFYFPFLSPVLGSLGINQVGDVTYFFNTGVVQTYVVPSGASFLRFFMWAAGGLGQNGIPNANAGSGGYTEGVISVLPGATYYIIVGGIGPTDLANGGGSTGNANTFGGGFTGIFSASPAVANVIAIAGGGGGGGVNGGGNGGGGGYPKGTDATLVSGSQSIPGTGGTQTAGGTGFNAGTQLQGGSGSNGGGGGGGGGWWGGGSSTRAATSECAGGGGGSSTYISSVINPFTLTGIVGVIQAPNELSPYYIAPLGRQGQNGLLAIGPASNVNISTSIVEARNMTVSLANISSITARNFNRIQYTIDTVSTGNTRLLQRTLLSTTVINTLNLSTVNAFIRTSDMSSMSSFNTIGNSLQIDTLRSVTNRISSGFLEIVSTRFIFASQSSLISSLSISSFFTSSLRVTDTITSDGFSTTLRLISAFTLQTSTLQSRTTFISTVTLDTINGSFYEYPYTNTSTIQVSSGRLFASSMNALNFASTLLEPLWIASGNDPNANNRIKYSYDGINWINSEYSWNALYGNNIVYNGSNFFILGVNNGSNSVFTNNGRNFTSFNPQLPYMACGIGWNGKQYAAVGNAFTSGVFNTSSDGINWLTTFATAPSNVPRGIAWGSNIWVVVGIGTSPSNIVYSRDAINWSNSVSGAVGNKLGIAYNGYVWVTSGAGTLRTNRIQYSLNGLTWSNIVSGGFDTDPTGASDVNYGPGNNRVAWNGSIWVVVGEDSVSTNTIQYSFDGSNFLPANSGGFGTEGRAVTWGGNMWVATGDDSPGSNMIKYSYDGSNWLNGSNTFSGGTGYSVAFNSNILPTYYQSSILQIQRNAIPSNNLLMNKISFGISSINLNDTMYVGIGAIGINRACAQATLDVNGTAFFSTLSTQQVFTSSILVSTLLQPFFSPPAMQRVFTSSLLIGNANGLSTVGPAASNIRLALYQGDAYKPTGTTWNITSDQRIKENIIDADLSWCYSDMKSLELRRFTYLEPLQNEVYDKYVLGFVAQEVKQVVPKATTQGQGFGLLDLCMLNMDQLTMVQFGALQKTIRDTEAIESTTFSLLRYNSTITAKMSTLEAYFSNVGGNV